MAFVRVVMCLTPSKSCAMLEFEARVASVIETGAADRATALRWIADADGCADDLEHLCYVNGLPFSYFDKEVS